MKKLTLLTLSAVFIFMFSAVVFAQPKGREGKQFNKERGAMGGEFREELREKLDDPEVKAQLEKTKALRNEARVIADRYRTASDADKPKIKEEYRVKMAELYDLRIKGMERRIAAMQKNIEEFKTDRETKINEFTDKAAKI